MLQVCNGFRLYETCMAHFPGSDRTHPEIGALDKRVRIAEFFGETVQVVVLGEDITASVPLNDLRHIQVH